MAIVKAIANTHGATLSLHEGPDGKGLAVSVTFQAAGSDVPPQVGASSDSTAPAVPATVEQPHKPIENKD